MSGVPSETQQQLTTETVNGLTPEEQGMGLKYIEGVGVVRHYTPPTKEEQEKINAESAAKLAAKEAQAQAEGQQ